MKLLLDILDFALRLAIALLFLFAAATKILDINAFHQAISDFGIVHETMIVPTAWGILIVENVGAVGLICNFRFGLILITGLLLLFIGVLCYGLWLGLEIDCGCFGIDTEQWTGKGLWPALWRDIILLGVCVLLVVRRMALTRKRGSSTTENNQDVSTIE